MRKPFTKAMVQTIEEKFKVKLTPEEIEAGFVKIDYDKGFGITTIEVQVGRDYWNNKFIGVSANFKGDSYCWLSGKIENGKLKKLLAKI